MKYSIIFFAMIILSSCNKFLDKPGDPTKKVPKTIADVQMMMDQPIFNGCTYIMADEYYITGFSWDFYLQYESNNKFYFDWLSNISTAMVGENLWKEPYKAVFNANLAIEILDKIPVTAANKNDWERAKGAAHFNRAWSFLTLAWVFSHTWDAERSKTDLGIVLDLDADFLNKLSRSTVAESYDQLLKDAQEAVKYLPMYPDNPVRPSKLATYGLLARAYLSMRKYNEALEQCNLYLSKLYALLDFNNPTEVDLNNYYPMRLFNKENIYLNNPNAFTSTSFPMDAASTAVDTTIYESFSDNDLRKNAWFKHNGEFYEYTGSPLEFDRSAGICTDELYITRAECFARLGETGKAMKDLNDLLITRWKSDFFIPFTASTKEEALEIILKERKKELLFRGLRWMDIKRFNAEGANISITRKSPDKTKTGILLPGSPRFALQLPADLVASFGYKQNPID